MSATAQGDATPQAPKGSGLPCETPGCSTNCAQAYSCHDRRMGRPHRLAWPLVALAILVLIGLAF